MTAQARARRVQALCAVGFVLSVSGGLVIAAPWWRWQMSASLVGAAVAVLIAAITLMLLGRKS